MLHSHKGHHRGGRNHRNAEDGANHCRNRHHGGGEPHHPQECRHARGDFWPGGERGPGARGERGMGHGGRMGRLFAHGDLHLVILHLIAEKPRHGYELIKAIEEMTQGAYSPSPGTIYPALTLLEEQGSLIAAASDGTKKCYAISEDGQAYLQTHQAAVNALLNRLRQTQTDGPSPRIVRAVENLKLALRLRLSQGPLDDAQTQALVETLDRVAGEIERI